MMRSVGCKAAWTNANCYLGLGARGSPANPPRVECPGIEPNAGLLQDERAARQDFAAEPAAIFFNDDCYVGWVARWLVEVAAMDPKLGPIFYTIDPMERGTAVQRFRRDSSCLSCHAANFTRDIPGVFARSVFAEATGSPIFNAGSEVVDHTTPLSNAGEAGMSPASTAPGGIAAMHLPMTAARRSRSTWNAARISRS
jgi:hypothetical protein